MGPMAINVAFPVLNILLGIAGVVALWYMKRMLVSTYAWRRQHATVVLNEQGISFTAVYKKHVRRATRPYGSITAVRRTVHAPRKGGRSYQATLSVQFTDGSAECFRASNFDSPAAFNAFAKQLRQQVAEARDGIRCDGNRPQYTARRQAGHVG